MRQENGVEEKLVGGVLVLSLNRPDKLNALTLNMMDALMKGFDRANKDRDIRCVILRGKGRAFCTGRDFSEIGEKTSLDYIVRFDGAYTAIFQDMRRLPKPVIAAVHGYAVGGGFSLAMGADFLVAHRDAQFGCLEMRHGFPAAINIALLSHHLGRRKALEIAMTGELISAGTLDQLGLVNLYVKADEDFEKMAFEFAEKLSRLDTLGVKFTKETFQAVESVHLEDALMVGRNLNLWLASSGKISEGAKKRENKAAQSSPNRDELA
jgi:enoyl-CoA hydratase/carnithine racemase